MANTRKTSAARTKPGRAKAPARAQASRPKGKAGAPASKAKTAKVGHPAAKAKVQAKPAKPPVPAKGARPVPAVGTAKGSAKGAKGSAKGPALKPGQKASDRKPPAEVRPLGVLPPESIARSTHKPPAPAVARPRPAQAAPQARQAPAGATRVTDQDLKEFEGRLLAERAKILKEMGHLETTVLKVNPRDSAGDLSGYSFHMADAGTDAMEREKAFMFASTEGRTLVEINEALRRLYRGEYGTCESCGNPIGRARLEAMPNARLCLSCKEKEEREQRGAV